ncbi:hypothetical protein KXD40_004009 [Peronospora effusa]|uniref:Crinkler effector protein N-terminal domain-containing protein n=1 Tax=Peronospora effusa TaxID=542832 RepID=A0A3M6VVH6_9STRA|nr:hypothetical protein DD238_000387 [Peronospora effusa]RQM15932.1 hypothetical protein DD237_006219 [Peronospora effusa]UIZ23228.1 hypothetical protein KXD40_004009 [Peronospora effusa]CAI5703000.1 unnamed protein product [Peronospora effusa]
MAKLLCVIVGVRGSAFPVEIDVAESVGDLKTAIKAEMANALKNFDADQLQLFMAKGTDDKWLKDDDDAAAQHLYKGEIHPVFQQMIGGEQVMAARTLQRWLFDNNTMSQPLPEQIHVLVVVPEQKKRLYHDSVRMREARTRESRLETLLEQIMACLPHKPSKTFSSEALGQLELERLNDYKQIIDFAPVEDGEAFWSKEIQILAKAITNEAAFIAFMTPFFSRILERFGLVYVNSEHVGRQASR